MFLWLKQAMGSMKWYKSRKSVTCFGCEAWCVIFHPKMGLCQIFFKALLAGLTNQHDISDSFAVTPLGSMFTILISGSDLLKHWREQLTNWMDGHQFSFNLIQTLERATHMLNECSQFLSVVLICSHAGEQLTSWMHHPFYHQWFWYTQTLKSDSLAECMFTHSHQWFSSAKTPEKLTA